MHNNVQQNAYISFILKFDTCLKNLGSIKSQGKQILTTITNMDVEYQILHKKLQSLSPQNDRKTCFIYQNAINNINKQFMQEIIQFQQFIAKYSDIILILKTISCQIAKIKKIPISDTLSSSQVIILGLIQVLDKLQKQYQQLWILIKNQWKKFREIECLGENREKFKEIKQLILHISFQTYVKNQSQIFWNQQLSKLSSARYKV